MISDRLRILRQHLEAIHRSTEPLDQATLGSVILQIMLIEDSVLDLEEDKRVRRSAPSQFGNVISFPNRPNL